MQVDNTTLHDLSIFHADEAYSIFHHFNCTQTNGGREWFKWFMQHPLSTEQQITDTHLLLKKIIQQLQQWPTKISNGTIMVLERYYETAITDIPKQNNLINAIFYKLLNTADYAVTKYTIIHCIDFFQGLNELIILLKDAANPTILHTLLNRGEQLLDRDTIQQLIKEHKTKLISTDKILQYGFFIRYHFKQQLLELIEIFSKLDAYYGMALATQKFQLCFPEISSSAQPVLSIQQTYHPLLQMPVAYDVELIQNKNFIFLTGANMAGKSTFIKAIGIAVYLAHIGMGVPAKKMQLSLFDGLLSNIQVADNIVKGESYFFNEVQRIKNSIEKINDGKKWLILIDELFKGTNVQDAMKCSTVVIEGLRKLNNVLFVLSTHLYEIGEQLQKYTNIQFKYFETSVVDDQLQFSYQLKEGISNDRLGYLILKREGVVELLKNL
jgi:DNA mismatch repair ATPase MutS